MRLKNKVALITGGGAGIGRASAVLFSSEGARVVVAERDTAAGEDTVREIIAAGGDAIFVQTDVTEDLQVKAAVERTVEVYGGIDVLYNNVGGSTLRDGPVTTAPFEEFWSKIKIDVFGTWLGCHYAIPKMIERGGGSVINTTSMVALMGTPSKDAYTAAKGAVASLTRSMAVEFGKHKIRVNALAPAATLTDRVVKILEQDGVSAKIAENYLLGYPQPIDIANAALYLASDESRVTTGQILAIDSGITIS
ncbi:SDR family oxidoreductase [Hoeflea sp. G2-23]|uniref:SDR family oxidoreductase n=1 Tax=Hoeflea algicola TaxID=2983763 RepID=A0ABT3ZDG2_9HYPH|nr:SDR family oxidoreductase [Hoeflea algicola]MCY0149271.1 SDR family oxidoreductase [Hoeflea algicola]